MEHAPAPSILLAALLTGSEDAGRQRAALGVPRHSPAPVTGAVLGPHGPDRPLAPPGRVVSMCKYFQENVKELSLDYYHTLRRHNYVTPTSYLELILTFKTLLNRKRQEVDTMRSRYLTGLQKLEFAASQVSSAGDEEGQAAAAAGGTCPARRSGGHGGGQPCRRRSPPAPRPRAGRAQRGTGQGKANGESPGLRAQLAG